MKFNQDYRQSLRQHSEVASRTYLMQQKRERLEAANKVIADIGKISKDMN
jgi:hypothetical protein